MSRKNREVNFSLRLTAEENRIANKIADYLTLTLPEMWRILLEDAAIDYGISFPRKINKENIKT